MSARFQIAPHIAWRDVEGELVLFDETSGRYHVLNTVGSLIWRQLSGGADPGQIAAALAERFDAPVADIASDVAAFIDQAVALELISAQSPAGAA